MNINAMLWVVQFILSLKFITVALTHGLQHRKPTMQQAIERMGVSIRLWLRGISILMCLGALGLVLPAFIHSLAWLAPLSAAGLTLMMAASIVLHQKSRQNPLPGADLILLGLCAFVAYGRWVLAP